MVFASICEPMRVFASRCEHCEFFVVVVASTSSDQISKN